jgi:hypothetical protein
MFSVLVRQFGVLRTVACKIRPRPISTEHPKEAQLARAPRGESGCQGRQGSRCTNGRNGARIRCPTSKLSYCDEIFHVHSKTRSIVMI